MGEKNPDFLDLVKMDLGLADKFSKIARICRQRGDEQAAKKYDRMAQAIHDRLEKMYDEWSKRKDE